MPYVHKLINVLYGHQSILCALAEIAIRDTEALREHSQKICGVGAEPAYQLLGVLGESEFNELREAVEDFSAVASAFARIATRLANLGFESILLDILNRRHLLDRLRELAAAGDDQLLPPHEVGCGMETLS